MLDCPKGMKRSTYFYQKQEGILGFLFTPGERFPVIRENEGFAAELAPLGIELHSFCTFNCTYCNFKKKNRFIHNSRYANREKVYNLFSIFHIRDEIAKRKIKDPVLLSPNCDVFSGTTSRILFLHEVLGVFEQTGVPVRLLTKGGMRTLKKIERIRKIKKVLEYGTTVLSLNLDYWRILEPNVPSPYDRLAALNAIRRERIPNFLVMSPILSYEDAKNVILKSAEYTDRYVLGAFEGKKEIKDLLGIQESYSDTVEQTVNLLNSLGKKWYASKDLQKKAKGVILNPPSLEEFWNKEGE